MMLGLFIASLVAAFAVDALRDTRGLRFTRGQADAVYLIMIISLLGIVVTVPLA